MSKCVFGILSNKQRDLEIVHIIDNICDGLLDNSVQYYFLDDFDSTQDINNACINALLSVNGTGIDSWRHILQGDIPLLIWIMDAPIKYYTALQSISAKKNLILMTSSAQDLNFIRRKNPNIVTKFMPVAYDPCENINNQERTSDILYFNPFMTDVDADEKEMKDSLAPDAYKIISNIIEFSLRNPEISLWQAFNYFSILYNYDNNDFELYMDIHEKIGRHISNLKTLNILKKLGELNMNIYGSPVWGKYVTGKQQYLGEIDYKEVRTLLGQYKIVFNIDAVNNMLALTDYSLAAMASGALYITENNLQMQYYFPRNDFDIYYNPLCSADTIAKIKHYLNNYHETENLRNKLQASVVQNHTWQARMSQFVSLF